MAKKSSARQKPAARSQFRIIDPLLTRLRNAAAADRRSPNSLAVILIEEGLNRRQQPA